MKQIYQRYEYLNIFLSRTVKMIYQKLSAQKIKVARKKGRLPNREINVKTVIETQKQKVYQNIQKIKKSNPNVNREKKGP